MVVAKGGETCLEIRDPVERTADVAKKVGKVKEEGEQE